MSGIAGAVFGGGFTFLAAQRKLYSDQISSERTKWREKIRDIASRLTNVTSELQNDGLWRELALNLNPFDLEDKKLIVTARKFPRQKVEIEELTERFALLLKHDWDRTKAETSWFPGKKIKRAKVEAERNVATPSLD